MAAVMWRGVLGALCNLVLVLNFIGSKTPLKKMNVDTTQSDKCTQALVPLEFGVSSMSMFLLAHVLKETEAGSSGQEKDIYTPVYFIHTSYSCVLLFCIHMRPIPHPLPVSTSLFCSR